MKKDREDGDSMSKKKVDQAETDRTGGHDKSAQGPKLKKE